MPQAELSRIIRYGKEYTFTFDYDGEPLKLRPLTSLEFDEAMYHSLEGVDPRVAGHILEIRLNLHTKKEINFDEIPEWQYKGYLKHLHEYDYWVVYYALKDFYEDVTLEKVKEMKYVHAIAFAVILASTPASKKEIVTFVKSKDGKHLGELVFRYNQPLAKIANLIPLQEEFLFYADPENDVKPVISKMDLLEIFPQLRGETDVGRT